MDYLLRDAAALRINLKWEVGPDLRLKFLLFAPFMPFLCLFDFAKSFVKAILFQLERFLEAGEPKLMDHHDWGQEETEETQKDIENNIEVEIFICFGWFEILITIIAKGLIVNGEAAKERTIVKRIAVSYK